MNIINTTIKSKYNANICLIADIHYSYKFNKNIFPKILDNVKSNNPGYICIVGDIIDYTEIEDKNDINELYDFIKSLANITKVIIALGNHDITSIKKDKKALAKHIYKYPDLFVKNIKKIKNVIFLSNETYIDNDIRFIGYEESYEAHYDKVNGTRIFIKEINDLLKGIDNKKYNILLSHDPLNLTNKEVIDNIKNYKKLNLIISGHTHNGMLPSFMKTNNLLISPTKKWLVKNGRGHMIRDNVDIIVTGGVTKLSERAKIFSLFNFVYDINIDYIKVGGKNEGVRIKR